MSRRRAAPERVPSPEELALRRAKDRWLEEENCWEDMRATVVALRERGVITPVACRELMERVHELQCRSQRVHSSEERALSEAAGYFLPPWVWNV